MCTFHITGSHHALVGMWRVEHEWFSNVWNLNLAGAHEGKHLCAAAHCVLVIPVTPPHIVSVRLAPTLSHCVASCSCYSCYTSSYWFGTHCHPVRNPCTFPVTPSHIECETRAHPVTPSCTLSLSLGAVHKWRHHFWGVSRPPLPLVTMSSFSYPPSPLCKRKWCEELFRDKATYIELLNDDYLFSSDALSMSRLDLRSIQNWGLTPSSDDVIYEQPLGTADALVVIIV